MCNKLNQLTLTKSVEQCCQTIANIAAKIEVKANKLFAYLL